MGGSKHTFTDRELNALVFIAQYRGYHQGEEASYGEIQRALGLNDRVQAVRVVNALRRKNYVGNYVGRAVR